MSGTFRYGWYANEESYHTRHEAIGELAVMLRDHEWLSPGAAPGFVLVADVGGESHE